MTDVILPKNDVTFISVFLIMTSNVIRAFFAWDGSYVKVYFFKQKTAYEM